MKSGGIKISPPQRNKKQLLSSLLLCVGAYWKEGDGLGDSIMCGGGLAHSASPNLVGREGGFDF